MVPSEVTMINEYIRYRVRPDQASDFEAAYAAAAKALAGAEQCVDYELSRCDEEPGCYVLRIGWTSAEAHLQGFRRSRAFGEFFSHIRPYVGDIEEMRHYTPTSVSGAGAGRDAGTPTLLEWAGGTERLTAVLEIFYARVQKDELLEPLFGQMSAEHPARVAVWLAEVFGGPADYTRLHGGHERMLRHHLGRSITEAQRRRWIELLVDAADEAGLPDDAEFRASLMAYIEWGTRLAKLFSQPGATPNFDEPVPRWGWVRPPWRSAEPESQGTPAPG